MKFPFGHHHRYCVCPHHHRRDKEGDEKSTIYSPLGTDLHSANPPTPSFHGRDEQPLPPSCYPHCRPVIESYDHPSEGHHPPIPADDHNPSETNHGYHRPREFYNATCTPVSRHSGECEVHRAYCPHLLSFLQHLTHQSVSTLSNQPTYKVITKANPDYSLAVRNGHVILAHSDPSDYAQHWYKDEKYSTGLKDEEGFPSFALVNKATGQAMKHSFGATHPVQLLGYNPEVLDESILWTQGNYLGSGFRAVRMINNIRFNVDAFRGDEKSGGVHDGTTIGLWHWNEGDNQKWKIVPYCKPMKNYSTFHHKYECCEKKFDDNHSPSETNRGYHCPRELYDAIAMQVCHDSGECEVHRGYFPFLSFLQHRTHQSVSNRPTYKMITEANPDYSLTVRNGYVILAHSDPSNDSQHWYKDEKYSTGLKDEEGFPSFALVNKATGQAMKHSFGATHPVQLLAYNPEVLDESILWTQGSDEGDGFRAVRMINNIRFNVDAFYGDKEPGVHDGTTIGLWYWNYGDNQRWKIVPYCKFLGSSDR